MRGGERLDGVVVEDGDRCLEQDRAVIEVFVDQVNCAAGYLYPVGQGLILSVQPGEGGQQGRMDVEDPIGNCRTNSPVRSRM